MRVPKYRRNPGGRAFIEYRGKQTCLGPYNSHASKEQYKQLIAQIMAQGREPVSKFGPKKFLVWQQWLIRQGYARTMVNPRLSQLKQ